MNGALPNTPFVLLDDARMHGATAARLYRDPVEIIMTSNPAEVAPLIARLKSGNWAGFISYEAGHALEPKLPPANAAALPLLWFGRFAGHLEIAAESVADLLPDPAGAWVGTPRPSIDHAAYDTALEQVQALIESGDIYQANLTFQASVAIQGHPLAVYAGLRARAKAGYGGVVWTGSDWLLSLSPELFFALHDGKITTKPMKGTATRQRDPAADAVAVETLRTDPKQRAENLMIVDLLRNDLSRVAEAGSVAVPHLFTVETYPTVHQMTSTVTAQLQSGLDASDVLQTIFPCGSITGAPKIRAMEVIHGVEPAPRGAYTGSIGRVDAGGDAAFNVAIRTLHLRAGDSVATLGLGSGIVADSRKDEEWLECHAKGRFVADQTRFDLIETMRFAPESGIMLLERHLARLKASAELLDFVFDRHAARNELQAATFRLTLPRRVRLLLSRTGQMAIEITALHPTPDGPVSVALAPLPVDPSDFRLRHKTSNRRFYESTRLAAGTFEVALFDADGFLTEGSFTNVFVKRSGVLLTPPLTRGLLPGTFRAELIDQGLAVEADLRADDLGDGFYVGNASRGLIAAQLI
jgi:para-aminobenzoate synthetase / 4-amino-4-deoxychorismate lyase